FNTPKTNCLKFIVMLAQLQTFPKIDEEIISEALKLFNKNVEKTNELLTWLTENTTNSQQQHYLMDLFRNFGNKLEKITISQTWRNCNNIFIDTHMKLQDICAIANLNDLKEGNELKILREMCLHILWNISKYHKHIKYRQIDYQNLYNCLFSQCYLLDIDLEQIFVGMEKLLQHFGFRKGNDDNWYYQYDEIQLLHLWKCYQSVIDNQIMYY
ncbi:hypothetical protein RFI_01795, partial [Reticulomyxa filosa]